MSGSTTVMRLDLVAEQLDAHGGLVVGRVDLDGVAPHPELAPHEVHVVALVLHVDELAQDRALVVRPRPRRTTSSWSRYSSGEPRP